MPKIPLYNSQVIMQTARGVTIDASAGLRSIEAESAAEQAVTNGIFNIMEETLGAGKEYLEKREESKRKADNNAYALWVGDLSSNIEEIKKKGYSAEESADDVYQNRIAPYLNESFDKWAKDNNIKVTDDMRQTWELQKQDLIKKELLAVEKIRVSQELDTAVKTAQLLYDQAPSEGFNPFEDADTVIDGLDITADKKAILKQQGRIDGFSFRLNTAKSTGELDNILKEVEAQKDSKNIGTKEYNQIVSNHRTIRARLYREESSPIIAQLEGKIAIGESLNEEGSDFKMLDKEDQERLRTKHSVSNYNQSKKKKKTESSKARTALLSRINDGVVDKSNYQDDELYAKMLPLDQQYIKYDIEAKERADKRVEEAQEQKNQEALTKEQQEQEADKIKAKKKKKKDLLDDIDKDIKAGEFNPERDPRYLELDPESKKAVDRLVTVRQRRVIAESEYLATKDIGVGYDNLMGMVTDFVKGQKDGENLKSMDEMSQLHDDIIAELLMKKGEDDTGELIYPPDVADRVLDIIRTLSDEEGTAIPDPLVLATKYREGSLLDVKLEAYIAFNEAFESIEFFPEETRARVLTFAGSFDKFFDDLKAAMNKPTKYGLIEGKDDQGNTIYTNKDEWIKAFVDERLATARRGRARRSIERSVINPQPTAPESDSDVMNRVMQNQYK